MSVWREILYAQVLNLICIIANEFFCVVQFMKGQRAGFCAFFDGHVRIWRIDLGSVKRIQFHRMVTTCRREC